MMFRVQSDEYLGIAGPNRPIGTVGLVDAGVGQPDIVENGLQLSGRNLLAQECLNLIAETRRFLHPQSGTRARASAAIRHRLAGRSPGLETGPTPRRGGKTTESRWQTRRDAPGWFRARLRRSAGNPRTSPRIPAGTCP